MTSGLARPHRREELRQRIEEMIREQRLWGQRLMPERQLAAELGVCRRTIQRVLGALEADGLVERHHGSGTYVRRSARRERDRRVARIAVIAEGHPEREPGWNYLGEMVRAVLAQEGRQACRCAVFSLEEAEERQRIWSPAEMRSFDGFISVACEDRRLLSHLLGLRRGPVVLLDHWVRDLPVTGVVNGSFVGMRALTRHLVALGHRRIAFLDCFNRAAENPEKFAGYRATLEEKGLFDGELVVVPERALTGAEHEEHCRRAARRLVDGRRPPTAVVGFDDTWALPAAEALEERGLRLGAAVSVAGYGDRAYRTGRCATLTSCRIYPRKMGRTALRLALERTKPDEARTVIVRDRPVFRESTGPAPHGQEAQICDR